MRYSHADYLVISCEEADSTEGGANGCSHLILDEDAVAIRERCARRVIQAALPDWVKGWFCYNLACFSVQQHQLGDAAARLQEATAYDPRRAARATDDPDLAALRDRSA